MKPDRKMVSIKLEGLPPVHSIESERIVLGAMISDPENSIDAASERLKATDFFHPAHQAMFPCLVEMRSLNKPIDPSTVLQYLEDRKLADSVGGAPVIGELSAGVISVLTAPTHIETVRHKSILRQLQQACAEIVYDIQERQFEPDAVIDDATSKVINISENAVDAKKTETIASVCCRRSIQMEEQMNRGDALIGITSGISELDRVTGGFRGGQLIAVCGRMGVGKSTLAMNFTTAAATAGKKVLFISLEMMSTQLFDKVVSSNAEISLNKLRDAKFSSDFEKDDVVAKMETAAKLPILFYETSRLTPSIFRAVTNKAVRKQGVEMVIIDYWQLCHGDQRFEKRNEELASISRALKLQAMNLNIPVIVPAQLNRDVQNQAPEMHNIADSDALGKDADLGILLWRDGEEDAQGNHKTMARLRKNRTGPNKDIELLFEGRYQRFVPRGGHLDAR
jgi:replicative DNA helicase